MRQKQNRFQTCVSIVLAAGLLILLVLPTPAVLSLRNDDRRTLDRTETQPSSLEGSSFFTAPLSFEANVGQTDPQVKFLSRGDGYTLFLTSTEAVIRLRTSSAKQASPGIGLRNAEQGVQDTKRQAPSAALSKSAIVRMELIGAEPSPRATGVTELPGRANYLVGRDSSKWRASVPTYAKVRYHEVYPGIDLVYYSIEGQLEYDFVVAPGADPRVIALGFDGADRIEVDSVGDLVLHVAGGQLRHHKPVITQTVNGVKRQVPGAFVLTGQHQVGFQIAEYDASEPLVIDPVLRYSTYFGGNGGELPTGIAADSHGNVYLTGLTDSMDFPTLNSAKGTFSGGTCGDGPCLDAFVSKFNSTGALVYSTYLGGSSQELSAGISVDTAGNAYITGLTFSHDFPTANAVQPMFGGGLCGDDPCPDVFLVKLNSTGQLAYSTYLGGVHQEQIRGLAVDQLGHAYLAGETRSLNFPTWAAAQPTFGGSECRRSNGDVAPCGDAFVTKLSTTEAGAASLVYSTFLGGGNEEVVQDFALDAAGNAYVTGVTLSTNFPTVKALPPPQNSACGTQACPDVFVTKLDTNLAGAPSLAYSTYLGGSQSDIAAGIAVDEAGNIYTTGITSSSDFPTVNAAQAVFGGGACSSGPCPDAFVTRLNPHATGAESLAYSTYLGGDSLDWAQGIAVDQAGNAYVTGITGTAGFPIKNGAQARLGGGADLFVTRLNTNSAGATSLIYSTYIGGSDNENFDDFMLRALFLGLGLFSRSGIALDGDGKVLVTGTTRSRNFPTLNPSQPSYGGGTCDNLEDRRGPCPDAVAIKLDTNAVGVASVIYSTYLGGSGSEYLAGMALDRDGNVYLAGQTTSLNLPTAAALRATMRGTSDAFVMKLAEGSTTRR